MSETHAPVRAGTHTRKMSIGDIGQPPIGSRIGNRALRRRAVLALYVGYPTFISAMWFGSFFNQRQQHTIAAPFLAVVIAASAALLWGLYVLLARTAINLPNLSDRMLDERQRRVRDEAYRVSFRLVSSILLGAALYMLLASGHDWPLPQSGEAAQAIFWGVLIVSTTLPTAVIAWTTPTPPLTDEELP